jgi:copper oxidase (laccase) domain-containing protein
VSPPAGGVSLPPFDSLQPWRPCGDDPQAVAENRRRLTDDFAIQPAWLKQVHGLVVADADPAVVAEADASWTDQPGIACTVMTADCLPALFCDRAGTAWRRPMPAGAGWRRRAGSHPGPPGVPPEEVLVWLGPAIGPQAFEVGPEVRDAFTAVHPEAAQLCRRRTAGQADGRHL